MFEFFVALFGGTYYGAKIAGEKGANKNYTAKVNKWTSELQSWRSRVTDIDLEEKIEAYVKAPENIFEVEKVMDEIYPELPNSCQTYTHWVRVFMACKGKIQISDATCGIVAPMYDASQSRLEARVKRLAFNDYMRWLEGTLFKNGATEHLLFVPTAPDKNEKRYYTLDEVDSLGCRMGSFEWEPWVIHKYLQNT